MQPLALRVRHQIILVAVQDQHGRISGTYIDDGAGCAGHVQLVGQRAEETLLGILQNLMAVSRANLIEDGGEVGRPKKIEDRERLERWIGAKRLFVSRQSQEQSQMTAGGSAGHDEMLRVNPVRVGMG